MIKTENLKKQLVEIADAVNAFNSEGVQVIVVERVLDHLIRSGNPGAKEAGKDAHQVEREQAPTAVLQQPKQPGTTKLLKILFASDFFAIPRSIGKVTDYLNENYTGPFYTYQISGLLLGFFKDGKLQRQVDPETNRFVYLNA